MKKGDIVIVVGIVLLISYAFFPGYYSARNPGTLFRDESGRLPGALFLFVLLIVITVALILIGAMLRRMQSHGTMLG